MAATEEVSQSPGDQVELTLLELLDLLEARLTKLVKPRKPRKSRKPAQKARKAVRVQTDSGAGVINEDGVRIPDKAGQPAIRKRQALGKSLLQLRQKPQA